MTYRNAHRDEETGYLSYLLRLWRTAEDQGRVWRASLQSTRTRQQVGFAELEALFEYLRGETSGEADPDLGGLGRPPRPLGKGGENASLVDPESEVL